MHDLSTRAWQYRRQASAVICSMLAAVFIWVAPPGPQAQAATLQELDASKPSSLGLTVQKPAHDIAISIVGPGQEGIQLSARLDQNGGTINRDIVWKVFDENGAVVSEDSSPVSSLGLSPGSYRITASYGSALFEQSVMLEAGKRLNISFLFNVGALRVLASLEGLQLEKPARNFIYATSGPDRGKLITISTVPGEVLRLLSGSYRLESRLEPGNALVITDVAVRAGIMSSIEVAHRAGVARLSLSGSKSPEVHWQILGDSGELLASLQGPVATAVLLAGSYRAEAQVAGHVMSARFEVRAGTQTNLVIGQQP